MKIFFNALKIKNYRQLALDIVDNNYHYFYNLFSNLKYSDEEKPEIIKLITYPHNDKKYTFELSILTVKDLTTYSIMGSSGNSCIIFFIAKGAPEVRLHTISYFDDCAKEGLNYPGGGTVLLQFVLDFLRQHKDRLKINKITLKDNSFKFCHGSNIELSTMYILMFGHTWYGKYGFRPFQNNKFDEVLEQEYLDNQKIMSKTLVKDVPQLEDYIISAFQKTKSNLKLNNILTVYHSYKIKGKNLMNFIHAFIKYYNNVSLIYGIL